MEPVTEPARIKSVDLDFDRAPRLLVLFDFGRSEQNLSCSSVDIEFIRRFVEACGQIYLTHCVGQVMMVTHTHEGISKISPMEFNKGKSFDIDAYWKERGD